MREIQRAGTGSRRRPLLALALTSALILAGPASFASTEGLEGQQADPGTPDPLTGALGPDAATPPEPPAPEGVTPRGAFVRSLLVPGWGHVASRSYGRAGFYVSALSGSLWMLQQAIVRRGDAESFLKVERGLATSRLMAGGIANPDTLRSALEDDDLVLSREALVEARDGQVEDWTALSIFLVLLGATDALVAAHLADSPEPLTFRALPVGDHQVELRVSVPLEWLPFGRLLKRR